jgi:ABC-2 type transport system permease protein
MSEISWARRFYWSVRRELWEISAIYIAPLGAAALVLVGFLIFAIHSPGKMLAPEQLSLLLKQPYTFAIGLIMVVSYIVAIFYSLDTLYGERRDRSILLWKSLPVSDRTTVLAKVTIPLVIVPLVGFAITVATLLLMMLLGSAVFAIGGLNTATLSTHPPFFRTSVLLLYHLFAVHALWWAPFFGWLFLVSAWARRTPFIWAAVPVIAISIGERIAFNTSYFADVLESRFNLSPDAIVVRGTMPIDPMTQMTPGIFVSDPGLWIGLTIAVMCLAIAVRLRRHQGPI